MFVEGGVSVSNLDENRLGRRVEDGYPEAINLLIFKIVFCAVSTPIPSFSPLNLVQYPLLFLWSTSSDAHTRPYRPARIRTHSRFCMANGWQGHKWLLMRVL